ncbi:hypothetical protein FG379_001372 [Cryptosporidium bovis]|uniref:uncharacterized protein n=1 Tax=Cryptosporidium bovis TaxID=310047 RepID=UPI00351A00A3|nr:hypothetical protein FG379_001372 [Cryptosporidium bovis]
MEKSSKPIHRELFPNTSLGATFLPLNNNKTMPLKEKSNAKDKKSYPSSSSSRSSSLSSSSPSVSSPKSSPQGYDKVGKKNSLDSSSESEIESKKIIKVPGKGKDEIKREVKNMSIKTSKNKKLLSSDSVPDDLRAQFELAVNKVRAYIEREYIDKMCEIDTENAIKLQKELNKILKSERDALEREKYNFEKRLREDMEKEMHAIIEVAAIENKKKADVSLAEIRKDIESHYLSRQKEVEQELLDKKKYFDEELEKRKKELEEEFNRKKSEYLATISERKKELEEGYEQKKKELEEDYEKRKKELEGDYGERKTAIESLFNEKISAIEKQFEDNLKIKLEAELAKHNTKQQSSIIEKEKEYLQGKALVNSLKEQLETMTNQKNELEKMSTTTIDSMKSYIKDLQESSDIQRNQIITMEKTIKAMYSKEQETMELMNKANEKLDNTIDIKEAKRIAYNSLLKGKALQIFDETLRNHYKICCIKKSFDKMKKLISRPKAVPINGDGKGLKGQDLTLFLLRKEQLALFAENENLMVEVENLKSKHLEELRKTQESFLKYRKEIERGTDEETNIALFEASMFKFSNIFNSKVKLQVLDAFLRIAMNSARGRGGNEESKKETSKQSNTINRDKEFIHLLNLLSYNSRIKLFSYCWRKLVFQTKLTPLKTLPTTPFNDITNHKGGNIDSYYMRDFINSIGKDGSVMSFAHQPNYYNKLPSVVNLQNKATFVPLRRDNPITYGTYFKYNKELLSESCVTGRPVGSFTNSIIN